MCFVCISQNAIYADSRLKFIGHRGMLNHRPNKMQTQPKCKRFSPHKQVEEGHRKKMIENDTTISTIFTYVRKYSA